MRLLAIGDIHGCYAALLALDSEVRFRSDDVIVVLGDFVDCGPDSRLVIDHLISLAERMTLVPLFGNHELMMINARQGGNDYLDWIGVGGNKTLDSYRGQALDVVPSRHWRFLEGCHSYYETERDFFVHANAQADLALPDQPTEMLFWQPFGHPPPHFSGRRMICGHTEQRQGRPLDIGHAVCIDTWAYGGGWLTCLDVRSGAYWQANQFSQVRLGSLGPLPGSNP